MLTVGKKLWWVPKEPTRRPCRNVEVLKVGRKWATLSNGHRIAIDSFIADGGKYSSPGRCYESKEQYTSIRRLNMAWEKFTHILYLQRTVPDGVTIDDIEAAKKLLRAGHSYLPDHSFGHDYTPEKENE